MTPRRYVEGYSAMLACYLGVATVLFRCTSGISRLFQSATALLRRDQ